ncbi:unnamed protein product, partial [Vitis vinifera]|uniref:Uncharacterized protein n=1 Tax=Vitis vinifera TaxID=29760 RepID=D7T418_VITVI
MITGFIYNCLKVVNLMKHSSLCIDTISKRECNQPYYFTLFMGSLQEANSLGGSSASFLLDILFGNLFNDIVSDLAICLFLDVMCEYDFFFLTLQVKQRELWSRDLLGGILGQHLIHSSAKSHASFVTGSVTF